MENNFLIFTKISYSHMLNSFLQREKNALAVGVNVLLELMIRYKFLFKGMSFSLLILKFSVPKKSMKTLLETIDIPIPCFTN